MAMRFCRECNNMLYPKENKIERKLYFSCRNCEHEEEAEDPCVYKNQLKLTIDDRVVMISDVVADPTLPRTRTALCAKCENNEAVFYQAASKRDEGMALFFVCCACGNRWRQ